MREWVRIERFEALRADLDRAKTDLFEASQMIVQMEMIIRQLRGEMVVEA